MNTAINLSSSPHLRDRWTTPFIMKIVLLSLLPTTVVGVIVNGWHALLVVLLSVGSAVASEWIFNLICKKPNSVWDCSAAVTGLLLALSLSPSVPLYAPVLGAVFAIVVAKGCFGGLGKNFINPALAGRCFLLISFGKAMTAFNVDGVSAATPIAELAAGNPVNITQMFLGTSNAVIGSSILAMLIGGLALWAMDIIHGQICFSVLGGFVVFLGLFGGQGFDPAFLAAHLCGGGVVMGAFFMATDYVTSPVSRLGQFIYGALIGVLGAMFRIYGTAADSFSYSIIVANLLTPLIDTYIVQKPFAFRRFGRKPGQERTPLLQRIPKPVIALTLITIVAGLALSGVYSITKDTIDEQKAAAARAAYRVVVPGAESFDTTPEIENALAELDGGTYGTGYGRCRVNEAYVAADADGNPAGYVVSVTSDDGFDGSISLAVGWSADGTMNGISFTELTETPGMGMRADEEGFKGQFRERTEYPFKLTKSGDAAADEISAISGATITSTAVVNAVNAASDFATTYMMGGK